MIEFDSRFFFFLIFDFFSRLWPFACVCVWFVCAPCLFVHEMRERYDACHVQLYNFRCVLICMFDPNWQTICVTHVWRSRLRENGTLAMAIAWDAWEWFHSTVFGLFERINIDAFACFCCRPPHQIILSDLCYIIFVFWWKLIEHLTVITPRYDEWWMLTRNHRIKFNVLSRPRFPPFTRPFRYPIAIITNNISGARRNSNALLAAKAATQAIQPRPISRP